MLYFIRLLPKNFIYNYEVVPVKKKILVPFIVLFIGICLVVLATYKTDTYEKEQKHRN